MTKTCLVQVDLDGLQVIAKDCSRESFSSRSDYVYESGLENLLRLFDHFHIKASLFVVGSDLDSPGKLSLLRTAVRLGHEFSNHTHTHPRWFKRLNVSEKRREIEWCHKCIEDKLGVSPLGFRAPGYSMSSDALTILMEFGYLYDSSVLPSAYDSVVSRFLYGGQGKELGLMYEPFSVEQFRKLNRPYRPSYDSIYRQGELDIWELPVTCIPVLKFPFHASYVLNSSLALFRLGTMGVRFSSAPLNYLLHLKDTSIDLEPPDLAKCAFNPISAKRLPERTRLIEKILDRLSRYDLLLASDYVRKLNGCGNQN